MITLDKDKLRTTGLLAIFLFSGTQMVSCRAEVPTENTDAIMVSVEQHENLPVECTEFQKLIDKTYDFSPSKLTEAQQAAKSAEMDVVWERVKGDQKRLLPCLMAALRAPNANKFFLFDGSTLMTSLDKSEDAKKLLIQSYARADLADIVLQNWIAPILRFGLEGLDTSLAGDAWLRGKDPYYYLPQHGTLKINKPIGSLAIFGSMDERFATPALAAIANQRDHPGREIAIDLLFKQVTVEAAEALAKLDTSTLSASIKNKIDQFLAKPTLIQPRTGTPKTTRDQFIKAFQDLADDKSETFMDLTMEVEDGEKDAIVVLQPQDVQLVRRARRFFASTGTPHAPEWYQSFTDILMYMVWKPEVEKRKTKQE